VTAGSAASPDPSAALDPVAGTGSVTALDPAADAVGPAPANGEVLLRAEHIKKYFPVRTGILLQREIARVHAVDDVSFELRAGETLGLVGESGCGKSTLARCIARLFPLTSGSIVFEGRDISGLTRRQLRPVRRDLQMVFQDPYASLNPRKRVGTVIADPMRIHRWGTREQIKRRVSELLELVGLSPEHVNRYPHEFSGGQRQRIGVARALALHPRLIIADEPASASMSRSTQRAVVDLPEPDSPTRPSVSPSARSKEIRETACASPTVRLISPPPRIGKFFTRSRTSTSVPFAARAPLPASAPAASSSAARAASASPTSTSVQVGSNRPVAPPVSSPDRWQAAR